MIVDEELGVGDKLLNIAIAARLVRRGRAQACTCTWRVLLDGVTLVEQPLVVELLEEQSQGLYIFGVVGDVGVVEVNGRAHLLGELTAFGRKLHHVLSALVVVILSIDILL